MGIQTEYNPDLALRDITEFKNGNRKNEECIPENLESGQIYEFLKEGQRNYWIQVQNKVYVKINIPTFESLLLGYLIHLSIS